MMSLMLFHISWTIVIVAAFVGFVIGVLWYSPLLFGHRWARLVGVKMDSSATMAYPMAGAFLISLAHAYGLAWFLENMQALNVVDALIVVDMLALIFVGANMVSAMLWERRPFELVLINLGSTFACYAAMALVFVYTVA